MPIVECKVPLTSVLDRSEIEDAYFWQVYLFFIVPLHRWGVKRLMARAVDADRL